MVAIPEDAQSRLGDMPSGEPVPEGVYMVRVAKSTFKRSKRTAKSEGGKPMLEVAFSIFGPENQEEWHGRKLFENLMLSGEGRFRTRQFLESSGQNEDFVIQDSDDVLNFEVGAFVGLEKERRDPETREVYPARNKTTRFIPIDWIDPVTGEVTEPAPAEEEEPVGG